MAGRARHGAGRGPLSTSASCHRDAPGPVCPQEGAAEGPEETDTEERGSDTLTHMWCIRLPTRTHMLTHTHTQAGTHSDLGRSVSWADGERPTGTAFVLGSLGWVRLACGPLLPQGGQ